MRTSPVFTHGVYCNALLLVSYRCPNLNCSHSSMRLVKLLSLELVGRYGYDLVQTLCSIHMYTDKVIKSPDLSE